MLTNSYSKKQIQQRNLMLEDCLRPCYSDIKIQEQYPLILDEKNQQYSFSIVKDEKIISHANLQARQLKQNTAIKVGLIGNVATHPGEQGKGHIKRLLAELENVARAQGLNALILWSDLDKFYQKLGYKSLSLEYLFTFNNKRNKFVNDIQIHQYSHSCLDENRIAKWLELRDPSIETLIRSTTDFKKLLSIPQTHIFDWSDSKGKVRGYLIIGKGFDMTDVVHEWACINPTELIKTIENIMSYFNLEELRVLSPFYKNVSVNDALLNSADKYEKNPMAWIKPLDNTQKYNLEEMFIWGLDSI